VSGSPGGHSRWLCFYESDPKSIDARLLSVIVGSCLSRVKKSKPVFASPIRKTQAPDTKLRFSFEFFDQTDDEMCPANFKAGYTRTLMGRLKDISSWTVSRFCGSQDHSLRNHQHDWTTTSRPNGFEHLNEHFRIMPGWQFCLSANEHGRVHGIIISDTFYVIWLDQDHRLYP
jgi:hypothetical protein